MPDGLYDSDALAWSEQQANLLRRLAVGERVNETVDWPNVIEEVETVGLSELRSCQNLLRHALIHLLKLHAWPSSQAAGHWTEEAETFLDDAQQVFAPSIRQRIKLDELYSKALKRVRGKSDESGAPRGLPDACPFALEDLLAADADIAKMTARLSLG